MNRSMVAALLASVVLSFAVLAATPQENEFEGVWDNISTESCLVGSMEIYAARIVIHFCCYLTPHGVIA